MTGRRPLRVLAIAARAPWPLNSGGRIRQFHFLEHLARSADVQLVIARAEAVHAGFPLRIRVVVPAATADAAASPTGQPAAAERPLTWALRSARVHFGHDLRLAGWLRAHARPETFDVALVMGAAQGVYAADLGIPYVWDAVDELVLTTARRVRRAAWGERPSLLRYAALYALFEREVSGRAAATLFAAELDAAHARRWNRHAAIHSLSNGVDCEYFQAVPPAPEPGLVAFIGSLEFLPNVDAVTWFARRIWPGVRHRMAGSRLLLVGRSPTPEIRALAELSGVAVHADVPDVRPYLARAGVIVVPSRMGAGVKNKLLEACAAARPVVASPQALAGLAARPGIEVLCARTPAEWSAQIIGLLGAPQRAAELGRRGAACVRAAHRWPELAARLAALLAAAARREVISVDRATCPTGAAPAAALWPTAEAPCH